MIRLRTPGRFNLQIDGTTEKIDAADGDTTGEKTLNTGTHTVGEIAGSVGALSDYQKSIVCLDTANQNQQVAATNGDDGGPLNVPVTHGSDIVCTITNVRETGKLEVVKDLDPGTDTGRFNLQINGATEKANAADGDTTGEKTLNTGGHTVGETQGNAGVLSDYQKSIVCLDTANQNQQVAATNGDDGGPLNVTVTHGSDIVCTITNVRETGTIKVTKVTDPAGLTDAFAFTPTGFGAGGFNLQHGQTQTFNNVPTNTNGAYKVSEASANGYRLVDIACDDNDSTDRASAAGLNGGDREATINLSHNETVECVFTNRQINSSTVLVKAGNEFVYHGDNVTYDFTVTNTGDGPLHDVVLTDTKCTDIQGPNKGADATPATLDPGESWTYTCTKPVPDHADGEENPIVNTATVTAKDEFDRTRTDTDDHSTVIRHPAIALDKTGPAGATAGELVEFTIVATNPGDRPLSGVDVNDNRCISKPALQAKNRGGGVDPTPDTLDPGDSWVYTCSSQTQAGQTTLENTATVTATDGVRGVSASDTHTVTLTQLIIAGERVTPGSARLGGRTGCQARPFTVRVKGKQIVRVEFSVDGKKKKTVLAADSAGRWTYKVDPRKYKAGRHKLVARTVFDPESGTAAKKLTLKFSRCVRAAQAPAFTG